MPTYDYLSEFMQQIKDECVLNRKFFLLVDVPDLIINKKISRKDYQERIIGFLKRVKKVYLYQKKEESKEEVTNVTDDDLIPFACLDEALRVIKHKDSEQFVTFNRYIDVCFKQVEETVAKLGIDAPKMKKIVSENILSGYINSSLESDVQEMALNMFINKQLYQTLVKEGDQIMTADQFVQNFNEIFKVQQSSNKYNLAYK